MSDIRTKWHDLIDAIHAGRVALHQGRNPVTKRLSLIHHSLVKGFDYDALLTFMKILDDKGGAPPLYFFEEAVVDMVLGKATTETIKVLAKFKLDKLPQKLQIVEFPSGNVNVRHFQAVMERKPGLIEKGEHLWHPFSAVQFSLYQPCMFKADGSTGFIESKPYAVVYPLFAHMQNLDSAFDYTKTPLVNGQIGDLGKDPPGGTHFYFRLMPYMNKVYTWTREDNQRTVKYMSDILSIGLRGLLTLMRTQGIDRPVATAGKINKARIARGKRPIPDHTVVRFGYYYKASGERVKIDPNAPKTGITQRMHERCAHIKMQPHGPGNKLRKMILVEACIVNFNPDEKLERKRKVVKT